MDDQNKSNLYPELGEMGRRSSGLFFVPCSLLSKIAEIQLNGSLYETSEHIVSTGSTGADLP